MNYLTTDIILFEICHDLLLLLVDDVHKFLVKKGIYVGLEV